MEFQNNWAITTDPSTANIGNKEFNFTLNSKAFGTDGSYDASDWASINANGTLALDYESEVAPQKEAINESMANVVFTVDWDADQENTPDKPVLNATHEVDKAKMVTALRALTGTLTFRDSTEVPATYDSATDISTAGDGSVMAYITGQGAIVQADGGVLAPQDCNSMFTNYAATSIDLRGLDTSNATDMQFMFTSCKALTTLDVSSLDTSNVTNMRSMFSWCDVLTAPDLSNFDTSNVTDMSDMFMICRAFTSIDLSSFDTSNVIDMSYMFNNCNALATLDLSRFDTSNVVDMEGMFISCRALTTLDLNNFDTTKLKTMDRMFSDCIYLTTVYAKTQADADKLNSTSDKPATVSVVVKA